MSTKLTLRRERALVEQGKRYVRGAPLPRWHGAGLAIL